jgi:hypothetical protein
MVEARSYPPLGASASLGRRMPLERLNRVFWAVARWLTHFAGRKMKISVDRHRHGRPPLKR